ncbi:MAG: winged helix-turn-helix transcriptional regulator [Acidobacteria bacterium]|nr:winged helix-turn-helix transcriptional regulator [Acidobacteriota bacterium]
MVIDIERLVLMFRALGERSRLRILGELLDEPRHVGELVRRTGLRQSLVSHHLKVLREAGLVVARRQGPFVFYELSDDAVRSMLASATDDGRSHGHDGGAE